MSPGTGSRAGLIAGLVVSVIIAVSMIVVSIFTAQKLSDSERALQELRDRDKPFVIETDITDPRVLALNQLKEQPAYAGLPTALQVSLAESDQLSKLIGANTTPDKAPDVARSALTEAGKKIDGLNAKKLVTFTLPKDNLISAVTALTEQVARLAAAKQDVQNQLAASEQKNQQTIASKKAELEAKDKLIADQTAKADAAVADAKKYQDDATAATAALQASANTDLKKTQDANAALTTQLQARDKAMSALTKSNAGYKTKLRQARVSANEPIVQHPDGEVIRVTENKTCFINLGERQHATKGLTFEVYDKTKGVPALGDGLSDVGLPLGKASIEVFNVGPDTSECRIIKVQPGQAIVIGDLIANLVYDPTVKYNFVVYGDFDLSGSGNFSPTDAEVIKRLITQWGGKVQDHVDVNTDFVIMGAEPAVPAIADPNDPGGVLKHQQALEKQQKYQAVVTSAGQFSVPVMNQNRFLYFIGYFDQANR
jgi:hypothetical protein